jgi:CBS domain-containing protein
MIALDVMTAEPTIVTRHETIRKAAELMARFDIGALPVVEDRQSKIPAGIITDRDIVVRNVAMGCTRDACVGDHMTARDLCTVDPSTDIADVMTRMAHDQIRRVLVVDNSGGLLGIITQGDLARHVAVRDAPAVAQMLREISTPHSLQLQPQH